MTLCAQQPPVFNPSIYSIQASRVIPLRPSSPLAFPPSRASCHPSTSSTHHHSFPSFSTSSSCGPLSTPFFNSSIYHTFSSTLPFPLITPSPLHAYFPSLAPHQTPPLLQGSTLRPSYRALPSTHPAGGIYPQCTSLISIYPRSGGFFVKPPCSRS